LNTEVYCVFASNWDYLELLHIYKSKTNAETKITELTNQQDRRTCPDLFYIKPVEVKD